MTMTAATTPAPPPASPAMTVLEARVAELESQIAQLRRDVEFERVATGIRIGREQADRGQTMPVDEAFAAMRKKYNIPRP